jgi:hypothetical protein
LIFDIKNAYFYFHFEYNIMKLDFYYYGKNFSHKKYHIYLYNIIFSYFNIFEFFEKNTIILKVFTHFILLKN